MNFKSGTTTDNFFRIALGQNSHLILFNDTATGALAFSFNGSVIDGFLYQEGIEFKDLNEDTIFVKSYNAGSPVNYRLFSYGLRKIVYPAEQEKQSIVSPDVPQDYSPYTLNKNFLK